MSIRNDRSAIQPVFMVIAVVLVAAFALVSFAVVAMTDHAPLVPPGEDADDALGYLSISAHVTYMNVTPDPSKAGYAMVLGIGDHEGSAPQDMMFFQVPDGLTALGNDFAVTFDVTYPDGTVLSDTQLTGDQGDAFDHTFVSDPFMVFSAGTYLVKAYFFVDGTQIGSETIGSCTIDGVNWTY